MGARWRRWPGPGAARQDGPPTASETPGVDRRKPPPSAGTRDACTPHVLIGLETHDSRFYRGLLSGNAARRCRSHAVLTACDAMGPLGKAAALQPRASAGEPN